MGDRLEYQNTLLDTLIYHLGKFLQKGKALSFEIEEKHPEVSQRFINALPDTFRHLADLELLKTSCPYHHRMHQFEGLNVESASDPLITSKIHCHRIPEGVLISYLLSLLVPR